MDALDPEQLREVGLTAYDVALVARTPFWRS